MCECEVCKRRRRAYDVISGDDIAVKNELIYELVEALDHVELDRDMTSSVLNPMCAGDVRKLLASLNVAVERMEFKS